MKQSLTYHLTLFVIKLKGLKKSFSKDPIDYMKIRKGDMHQPKGKFFSKNVVQRFNVANTTLTEVSKNRSNNLVIFIHGGAFISGPAKHHWDTLRQIVRHTDHTTWLCNYPKAPEHKISEISKNIDAVYDLALEKYEGNQIVLLGDSVGGTLIASLMQRAIKNGLQLPNKIILVSPVMDGTMSNPLIEKIDKVDPMLSKAGVLSAKKMCAEREALNDEMISPLTGSFSGFPKTFLFAAENDITYPDQKLAVQKLIAAKVEVEIIEGKNMPHIWPLLPIMKEAKIALKLIIDIINGKHK